MAEAEAVEGAAGARNRVSDEPLKIMVCSLLLPLLPLQPALVQVLVVVAAAAAGEEGEQPPLPLPLPLLVLVQEPQPAQIVDVSTQGEPVAAAE